MQPGSSPVSVRLPFEPGGHTRKAIGEKVGTRVESARTYVLDVASGDRLAQFAATWRPGRSRRGLQATQRRAGARNKAGQAADIRSFGLEPGDVVAFDFHTLHNAPPNRTTERRARSARVLSARTPAISNAPTRSRRPSPISASAPTPETPCGRLVSSGLGAGQVGCPKAGSDR